jgi:hypothetical protein
LRGTVRTCNCVIRESVQSVCVHVSHDPKTVVTESESVMYVITMAGSLGIRGVQLQLKPGQDPDCTCNINRTRSQAGLVRF